jgi:hypothetical protein
MKNFPSTVRYVLGVGLVCVAAVAQAQQIDAEQFRQLLLQRLLGQTALPVAETPQRAAQPLISEAEMARRLEGWPLVAGTFAVERFRDGFAIAGERVLDPEGRIVQYAVDSGTGDAAYLMEGMPGQFVVKLMRYRAGQPMTIANATRQSGQWSVETVTGVRINGSRLTLNSRGFVVARDNALFRYMPGVGLRSHGLPETHTLAAHQNGDIGATGWLLLEKRQDTKEREGGVLSQGSLGELFGAVKSLGAALGVSKSDSDYALYHLETGKTVPLGISLGDKTTSVLSQCQQRNRWVAQCDRLDTVESLYGQDGYANRSHYYWRVSWFNTPRGAVAVVMQDGITKIDAIELSSDRRVSVFQRSLGIGDWSTSQQADGRVQVKAKLGFEAAQQNDVASLFEVPVAAVVTQQAAEDLSATRTEQRP